MSTVNFGAKVGRRIGLVVMRSGLIVDKTGNLTFNHAEQSALILLLI